MKILLVGPLGATPWEPARDVAAKLREQGAEVDLHNPSTSDIVIDYPQPYNPRTRREAVLAFFLLTRVRAFIRWRRAVRPRVAGYTTIVVWDPLVAVMLAIARPRPARVVWSETGPVVDDAWSRVVVRLARRLCDRTIAASGEEWYAAVRW